MATSFCAISKDGNTSAKSSCFKIPFTLSAIAFSSWYFSYAVFLEMLLLTV